MKCIVKHKRIDYKGKSYNQGETLEMESEHLQQALNAGLIEIFNDNENATNRNIESDSFIRPKKKGNKK